MNKVKSKAYKLIFNQYKSSAKKRGLSFNLTLEDIIDLTSSNCDYCNSPPSNKKDVDGTIVNYNGIDRLVQSIGYEKGNVVPCCKFCNTFRATMKLETWIDFLNGVVNSYENSKWKTMNIKPDEERSSKSFFGVKGRRG